MCCANCMAYLLGEACQSANSCQIGHRPLLRSYPSKLEHMARRKGSLALTPCACLLELPGLAQMRSFGKPLSTRCALLGGLRWG